MKRRVGKTGEPSALYAVQCAATAKLMHLPIVIILDHHTSSSVILYRPIRLQRALEWYRSFAYLYLLPALSSLSGRVSLPVAEPVLLCECIS